MITYKMINEAAKSPDYIQGYNDAVERMRQIIDDMKSQGKTDDEIEDALDKAANELNGTPGRPKKNQNANDNDNDSKNGGSDYDQNNDAADLEKAAQDAVGGNNSKNNSSRGSEGQGQVRPEDCMGPNELNNIPDTAGGMISREAGEQIAKGEGYEKGEQSQSSVEKDWKDAAMKAAQKLKGSGEGSLVRKINDIYKTSTDWKKELRLVVGQAINEDDKRSAYANKNVLVSQNRIARTDKDKYDALSYIVAFIDTSGSMGIEQLRLCLQEVYSVALRIKPMNIYIVQCDTKIQSVEKYSNLRDMLNGIKKATVKGGGGTELKPCWDLLKNDKQFKGRQAELVMCFTDGYLEQYKRDPKTMGYLCWCILDNTSFELKNKDPRTKVIHLKSDDIK